MLNKDYRNANDKKSIIYNLIDAAAKRRNDNPRNPNHKRLCEWPDAPHLPSRPYDNLRPEQFDPWLIA